MPNLARILSGGYSNSSSQGLHDGDIAEILSEVGAMEGVYLMGLPGTPARENYPFGLYFIAGEWERVEEKQEGEVKVIEAEGKYFRNQRGWVVGPLVSCNDMYYRDDHDNFYYKSDLSNRYRGSHANLIPEPVDLGESVVVTQPSVGDCVSWNNMFFWVERKDVREVYLVNSVGGGYWRELGNSFVTYPSLSVADNTCGNIPQVVDKWVYDNTLKDMVKVVQFYQEFSHPANGVVTSIIVRHPSSRYNKTRQVADLDFTKVEDNHPRELTMVRGFQGEGSKMYAKDVTKGSYLLLAHSGYGRDYYALDLDTGNFELLSLREDSPWWWTHDFFKADELPFTLPFDYELCVETVAEVCRSGFSEVLHWIKNNVSAAFVPALLSRTRAASNTRGNVALYLNSNQMKAGKIQSLRPGRAFRALCPDIKDADLEKLVDKFRKDFPSGDYTLKRGFAAEDFKRAYSGTIAPMQNPLTTYARKSLANSCMRHSFSFPTHPAEAYASGEFEMLWSETESGQIASRMVVWHPPVGHRLHGKPQCGPVYGTCEYSMDLLVNAIKDVGGDLHEDSTWEGAKLARLPAGNNYVYLPYMDKNQGLMDRGDYLEATDEDLDDCDIQGNNTGGTSYIGSAGEYCSCSNCGDRTHEGDLYGTPDGDMCEQCYSESYFTCEEYDEVYHVDEVNTAYRMTSWGRSEVYVCEDALSARYTECTDGRYWHNDDILELADGTYLGGGQHHEAGECDFTNEYYLWDELMETWDGRYMSRSYFDSHEEEYKLNDDGIVVEYEEEKEEAA